MESIQQIPLEQIERGDNDRTVFDQQAITELADNIQAHGLVQPISVRPIFVYNGGKISIKTEQEREEWKRILDLQSKSSVTQQDLLTARGQSIGSSRAVDSVLARPKLSPVDTMGRKSSDGYSSNGESERSISSENSSTGRNTSFGNGQSTMQGDSDSFSNAAYHICTSSENKRNAHFPSSVSGSLKRMEGAEQNGHPRKIATSQQLDTDSQQWPQMLVDLPAQSSTDSASLGSLGIIVRDGKSLPVRAAFEVVAGERRYKAVQSLGWATIAAIVRNLDDQEAAGVMLAENLARADLNPIDEARAYNKRMQLFGWNVQECATRCKVPGLRIRERLALLNLTDEIQRRVAFGHLRLEYAQPMCDLDHNRQSIALQYLTVREGRRMSVTEFKAVCSRLYGEQSQEVMFNFEDFADIANRRDQALEDQKCKRYIPTQSTLPDLAPAATIGLALEKYIYTLLQSENAEHIMAASVAGTIYTGLIKHGLCKQPDQSPLDNLKM